MATPTYKGAGQPTSDGGWLSGMGSWFGGLPPTYAAPAPKPAAAAPPAPPVVVGDCDGDRITLVIPRELIGSQQLIVSAASDGDVPIDDDAQRITLVIPRSLIQSQQ